MHQVLTPSSCHLAVYGGKSSGKDPTVSGVYDAKVIGQSVPISAVRTSTLAEFLSSRELPSDDKLAPSSKAAVCSVLEEHTDTSCQPVSPAPLKEDKCVAVGDSAPPLCATKEELGAEEISSLVVSLSGSETVRLDEEEDSFEREYISCDRV